MESGIVKFKSFGMPYDEALVEAKKVYTDINIIAEIIANYITASSQIDQEPSIGEIAGSLDLPGEVVNSLMQNPKFNDLIDYYCANIIYSPQMRRQTLRELANIAIGKSRSRVETTTKEVWVKGFKEVKNVTYVKTIEENPTGKEIMEAAAFLEQKQQRVLRLPERLTVATEDTTPKWAGFSPEEMEEAVKNAEYAVYKKLDGEGILENSIKNEQPTNNKERDYAKYSENRQQARKILEQKGYVGASSASLPPEGILSRKHIGEETKRATANDLFGEKNDQPTESGSETFNITAQDNDEHPEIGGKKHLIRRSEREIDYKTTQERQELLDNDPRADLLGGMYEQTSQKRLVNADDYKNELVKRAEAKKKWLEQYGGTQTWKDKKKE